MIFDSADMVMISGRGKRGEETSEAESIPGAAERAEGAESQQESPAPAHCDLLTI